MTYKITVPDGPEDMLLDTISSSEPRLIVSCTKRRGTVAKGKICWIDLATREVHDFEMPDEKPGEYFQPHGIDMMKVGEEALLYVISHTVVMMAKKDMEYREEIRIYKIHGSRLVLKQEPITNEDYIIHPNDIAALPDGSFYFTNDTTLKGKSRRNLELLLKGRSSNLTYYRNGEFTIVKEDIGFANGVEYTPEKKLLLTGVFEKELMVFDVLGDGSLHNEVKMDVDKGMDNISLCGNGEALVPAHTNNFKFFLHSLKSSAKSPSVAYRINYITGEVHDIPVYSNDGSEISAASTALEYNGRLYISQVFDGFIIVKPVMNGIAVSEA